MDLTWDWLQRLSANTLAFVSVVVTFVIGVVAIWAAVAPLVAFEVRTLRDAELVDRLRSLGRPDVASRVHRRMMVRIDRYSTRRRRWVTSGALLVVVSTGVAVLIAQGTGFAGYSVGFVAALGGLLVAIIQAVDLVVDWAESRAKTRKGRYREILDRPRVDESASVVSAAAPPSTESSPRVHPATMLAMAFTALIKWR